MVSKTFKRPRVRLAVGFEVRALAGAGSKPAAAGPKVNVVSSKASIQALAQLKISALLRSPDEAAATSRRLSCRCFALRMLEGMPICVLTRKSSHMAVARMLGVSDLICLAYSMEHSATFTVGESHICRLSQPWQSHCKLQALPEAKKLQSTVCMKSRPTYLTI